MQHYFKISDTLVTHLRKVISQTSIEATVGVSGYIATSDVLAVHSLKSIMQIPIKATA